MIGLDTAFSPPGLIGRKNRYCKADLESCASGHLFGEGNAQLPSGPLQLIEEITDIQAIGGVYEKGYAMARIEVHPDAWYFAHHFKNDPIFPGCLLIESIWQLTGFHLAWTMLPGRGRLIDSGRTRFFSSVDKTRQTLDLEIHIRKLIKKPGIVGVANGVVYSSGHVICKTENAKVALVSRSDCDQSQHAQYQ